MNTMNSITRIVALSLACGVPCIAQADDLYSNGSASPSTPALGAAGATGSGVSAPAFSFWSECPAAGGFANAVAGFSTHGVENGEYRFADNFTVPPGGWTLSAVRVYAYQPGVAGPASPFAALTLRIWMGQPGQPGSFVVWGDATTNRLSSSTSTGVYRVFNSVAQPLPGTPDTTRLIFETRAEITGLYLGEGSYWLDWQYTSVNVNAGAFSPAVTAAGSRGGGNALQYRAAYGSQPAAWVPVTDGGKPAQAADVGQDLPFRIEGVGGQVCDGDVNCDFALDGFDVEVQELAVGGDMTDYCQADPDFNRDFALDGFDVEAIEVAVGGGPCP